MKRRDPIIFHRYHQLEIMRQFVHKNGDTGRFEGRRQWNFAHKTRRFVKTTGSIGKIWKTKKGGVVVVESGRWMTLAYTDRNIDDSKARSEVILRAMLGSLDYSGEEIHNIMGHRFE